MKLVQSSFLFLVSLFIGSTANSAPTLEEAEAAFVDLICGESRCGPNITLASMRGPGLFFTGFPEDKQRLVGAVYGIICNHMDQDERLSGVCKFTSEVAVGISPQISKESGCAIDYLMSMTPRPVALNPEVNFAEIESCIVWSGLTNVLSPTRAIPTCSEEELGVLRALVATNEEFIKVVFGLEGLSNTHRLLLNQAFLRQNQKDKREVSQRLSGCSNLQEKTY